MTRPVRLPMRLAVPVRHDDLVRERHLEAGEDVHFAETLVEAVLEDLTTPGQRVLDPFAGFGTTLRVAERMGREAVGIELLPERCEVARQVAPGSFVVEGDAHRVDELVTGPFDLVLTSPPYRTRLDHPEDPFAAYERDGGDYAQYLSDLREIARRCLGLLRPSGHLVLNVASIATPEHFTPLAWDVGRQLAEVGRLVQDVPVVWDHPWQDLAGDYLLVTRPA